jgi:hypothetical protein
MSKYPLHEKLHAHKTESFTVSEFLDMLDEEHIQLGRYHEHGPECRGEREICMNTRIGHVHKPECFIEANVCGFHEHCLYNIGVPTKDQLIGMFLGIDPKELSKEKDRIYEDLVQQSNV